MNTGIRGTPPPPNGKRLDRRRIKKETTERTKGEKRSTEKEKEEREREKEEG